MIRGLGDTSELTGFKNVKETGAKAVAKPDLDTPVEGYQDSLRSGRMVRTSMSCVIASSLSSVILLEYLSPAAGIFLASL